MVEPSFLALTSTPSILPSSVEETWPVMVGAPCAWAWMESAAGRRATVVASNNDFNVMIFSLGDLSTMSHDQRHSDNGASTKKDGRGMPGHHGCYFYQAGS